MILRPSYAADAALIAASPDLLAALRGFLHRLNGIPAKTATLG